MPVTNAYSVDWSDAVFCGVWSGSTLFVKSWNIIWAASWENAFSVHIRIEKAKISPRSLIRAFAVHLQKVWIM